MTRFLERLRRAVPTTHDMPLYAYTDVIRRTSVLKTLRASLAARGLVIVGRGSSLRLRRGATLRLGPRAILLIGVAGQTPAGASIEVRPRGTLEVDGLVQVLRGSRVLADWDASLSIGDRTYLNEGAAITCALRLEIGPGCAIAPGVTITDTDTHRLAVDGRERPHHAATIVGPGCWIGTSALVLKGVTLGRGAVVAAGSVVTHDVLPGRLVGGVPARELAASVTWEA